jgi:hypothetical protein
MAEKTCPHGTPSTSFCKACERGDPPPKQATVADLHLGAAAAPATLSETEQARLAELEQTVKAGLKSFVEVGTALLEIRDQRLYRGAYGSFEAYCQQELHFSRQRGYQLMQAAAVATVVDIGNERQARDLAPLLTDPGAMRDALEEASVDGKPTGDKIRDAVARRVPARKPREAVVLDRPEQLRLEFDVDDRVLRWRAAAADAGMELEEWIAAAADAAASFVSG